MTVINPPRSTGGGTSPLLGGKVIGPYYTTFIPGSNWQAVAGDDALNVLVCFPIFLEAGTLDRLAIQQFGAGAAGELVRLGLYADNGSGKPGALAVDGGTVDLSTAAGIKTVTISKVVTKGLYWVATCRQGGKTVTVLCLQLNGSGQTGRLVTPMNTGSGNLYDQGGAWVQTGVTGALPDPFAGSALSVGSGQSLPGFVRYSA